MEFGELPVYLQKRCLDFLDYDALVNFRHAHEQFKHVCNNYVLQEFRKSGEELAKSEGSFEYASYYSIKLVGDVFMKCGYDDIFLVYITPLKFETSKGFAFCPSKKRLWKFLEALMDDLFTQSSYPSSQHQLLMVLIILNYLKQLKYVAMTTPLIQPGLRRFSFNLPGLKLNPILPSIRSGIRNAQNFRNEDERTMYIMKIRNNFLLFALNDLYVCSHAGQSFNCTLEKESEVFSYEYTTLHNATYPKTDLEISLNGYESTLNFLMDFLQNDPAEFVWPVIWPKDAFWCDISAVSHERSTFPMNFSENVEPIRFSIMPMLPPSCEEEHTN